MFGFIQWATDTCCRIVLPPEVWSLEPLRRQRTGAGRAATARTPFRFQFELLEPRMVLSAAPFEELVPLEEEVDVDQFVSSDYEYRDGEAALAEGENTVDDATVDQALDHESADAELLPPVLLTFDPAAHDRGSDLYAARNCEHSTPRDPMHVNQASRVVENEASSAASDTGRFVVVWSAWRDENTLAIYVRVYDVDGTAVSDEIQANDTTLTKQQAPAVAMGQDGSFVVAWAGEAEDRGGVYARQFSFEGTAAGDEIQVADNSLGVQQDPDVAIGPHGGFAIAWSGVGTDGTQGIFLQKFQADGSFDGETIQVSTASDGTHVQPDVAFDESGNLIILWIELTADGRQIVHRWTYRATGDDPVESVGTMFAAGLSASQPNRDRAGGEDRPSRFDKAAQGYGPVEAGADPTAVVSHVSWVDGTWRETGAYAATGTSGTTTANQDNALGKPSETPPVEWLDVDTKHHKPASPSGTPDAYSPQPLLDAASDSPLDGLPTLDTEHDIPVAGERDLRGSQASKAAREKKDRKKQTGP